MSTVIEATPRLRISMAPMRPSRQLVRFAAIGIVSTAAYIGLYAGLRTAMPSLLANALALFATAIANTAANRRVTFAVQGRRDVMRHQLQGLGVFAVALTITSGSLAALHLSSPDPARITEIAVLVVANLAATALRFVLLRRVFRVARTSP
ncbi:MAG TPA: GtrA family protein [Mycobacteriales bacterium]|jgi:putative flippase GtrA|nr:GtrA family protein [Mycobacteriales bacterium]